MLDMYCLVLAGPRERLSWRLNLVPRSQDPFHRGCSQFGHWSVQARCHEGLRRKWRIPLHQNRTYAFVLQGPFRLPHRHTLPLGDTLRNGIICTFSSECLRLSKSSPS
jgi:hypothetical protein